MRYSICILAYRVKMVLEAARGLMMEATWNTVDLHGRGVL